MVLKPRRAKYSISRFRKKGSKSALRYGLRYARKGAKIGAKYGYRGAKKFVKGVGAMAKPILYGAAAGKIASSLR